MRAIADVLTAMGWPKRLSDLEAGIRSNVPHSNNPEAFHERKSELANEARLLREEISSYFQQATGGHR